MKIKSTKEVACRMCQRMHKKHRARGLCWNCYQSWYYNTKMRPKGVTYQKPGQSVKTEEIPKENA